MPFFRRPAIDLARTTRHAHSAVRTALLGSAVAALALTSGCSSDKSNEDANSPGCGLASERSLQAALGTKGLSDIGAATPDPETGIIECDVSSTTQTGVFALLQVYEASPSNLRGRENWRGSTPTANPGCKGAIFINSGDLGGVACFENESVRLFAVSPTHVITVDLVRSKDAEGSDVDAALGVVKSIEKSLGSKHG
jgi:hypothetical protein